jgi:ubiquinone/menaquinone biosynthesis C-methylase UbiE
MALIMKNLVEKIYGLNARIFRGKRFAAFLRHCQPQDQETLLDVGGTRVFWESNQAVGRAIDVVNLDIDGEEIVQRDGCTIRLLAGDACALAFPDNHYDVVFSNSVIEHVGSWQDQQAFAREARRLGKKLWIQTPAKEFFIEPHYLAVFVHWLPKGAQKKLLRYCSLWGVLARPSPERIAELVEEIRLLTLREMKSLFPDCQIIKERFLFVFVKSYTAYRGEEDERASD